MEKSQRELKEVQERLEELSEEKLDELAKIMDVGFLNKNDSTDKEDKIIMLSTEPYKKVIESLNKMD